MTTYSPELAEPIGKLEAAAKQKISDAEAVSFATRLYRAKLTGRYTLQLKAETGKESSSPVVPLTKY